MFSIVLFVDRSIRIIRIRYLMKIFLCFSLIFLLYLLIIKSNWSIKRRGKENFIPFGEILGVSIDNVIAYSNGNDSFYSGESNYFRGVYSGLKWQCVEYARRWILTTKNATFESIEGAKDLWTRVNFIENIYTKKKRKLIRHENGSTIKPMKNSFLIYPQQNQMPFGHVAVIHQVLTKSIRIGEQNFDFMPWKSSFAREIPFQQIDGHFFLDDQFEIFGWMEIPSE